MAVKKKKEISFKKMLATIIIGIVAVAFVGSFALMNTGRMGGRSSALAVVNGEPIPISGDSLFANLYRQYYEEERTRAPEGISEEQNLQIMRRAFDTVIQRTLILQQAEKEGIDVSRDIVLASIVKKGYYASRSSKFDENRYNNTPESDRQRIFNGEKEQLIISMFLEALFNTARVSEVETKSFFQFMDYGKKIEYVLIRYDDVPQEELVTFYEENPKLFERAHAAHILIKEDEEKAKDILRRVIENPEQFGEIAMEESEDPTAEKGGDLGWFYRDDMVPEFSEAAFILKPGEISGVVKTMFGYHIIKALEPVTLQTFDEAIFRIKKEYVSAHREETEKAVSLKSKDVLTQVASDPSSFGQVAEEYGLTLTTTHYITLSSPYVLEENQNFLLYELMNNDTLIELVFSSKVGDIGGPVRTDDGELLFRVIEDKGFDQELYTARKDAVSQYYRNIKSNNLFNDWYRHTVKHSKIVDHFNDLIK